MADDSFIRRKAPLFLTLVAGLVFGAGFGLFLALTYDLPQIRSLEGYTPSAVTHIWSSDNELLGDLYFEKRNPIPLNEIPLPLRNAIIATEDRNFYRHTGIDIKGICRALLTDLLAWDFAQGASTITQQLAKTLFLSSQKTVFRKAKEALLSIQIERKYTKDEILTLYLNQVYFGSGAYGVSAAARTFFGKPVSELSLAECSLIAAMPKSPARYSPLVNIELSRKRRNIVLKQMHSLGMISTEALESAQNEAIQVAGRSDPGFKAPHFIGYIKERLEDAVGPSALYKGGLTVRTTLSYQLQQAAEAAIETGLSTLQERMRKRGIPNPAPEGALVALDISSGGILAMVGGRKSATPGYNRAVDAGHLPGAAMRPFVYAAALSRGLAQNTLIPLGATSSWDMPSPPPHREGGTDGALEKTTLREALTLSKPVSTIRLLEQLGSEPLIPFVSRFGIDSPIESEHSLIHGACEVTLLQLTAAYAVFPGLGCKTSPYGVRDVIGLQEEVVWQPGREKSVVMTAAAAAIMTDMLQGVIREGTGKKALSLKRPLGGNSGTTDQFKDTHFIGFSPTLAVGVWVGSAEGETLGTGETAARAALPIWIEFMEKALAGKPPEQFELPGDVVFLRMNPTTGDILPEESMEGVRALFKKAHGE